MTAIESLEQIQSYIHEKKKKVINDMGYANEHNFPMEYQALQYKHAILLDIDTEIDIMLDKLHEEEEE